MNRFRRSPDGAGELRTVSLADWRSGDADRRARFVRTLGDGLEEHGFLLVRDPGFPTEVIARAYDAAAGLFALPDAEKRACERPQIGRQRGWTPFGTEHAKDQPTGDLKEFWQVGRPGADPDLPANVFPAERADLRDPLLDLFVALESVARALLDATSAHLGLDPSVLAGMTAGGNSVLRVIHYPPLPDAIADGAVRAAAHEDINLMTVLPASTDAGLEILTRDGRWLAVDPPADALIVDTGDMMALLTGGRLPATTHRVVNPRGPAARRARFSLPFFVHPHPDARLAPFDGSGDGPRAADFLLERLIAIGVAPPHAGQPRS